MKECHGLLCARGKGARGHLQAPVGKGSGHSAALGREGRRAASGPARWGISLPFSGVAFLEKLNVGSDA